MKEHRYDLEVHTADLAIGTPSDELLLDYVGQRIVTENAIDEDRRRRNREQARARHPERALRIEDSGPDRRPDPCDERTPIHITVLEHRRRSSATRRAAKTRARNRRLCSMATSASSSARTVALRVLRRRLGSIGSGRSIRGNGRSQLVVVRRKRGSERVQFRRIGTGILELLREALDQSQRRFLDRRIPRDLRGQRIQTSLHSRTLLFDPSERSLDAI
jgi:hypothetical protein